MVTTNDAPRHAAPDALAYSPYRRRHGVLVGVILGTVLAAALAMATFIWYRWHAVVEPTTAVTLQGSPALDGTVVTVSGARTFTTRMDESNNYAATVLVEPGRYRVTAKHGEHVLFDEELEVERFIGVRVRLSDPAPAAATRPSSSTIPP